VQELEKITDDNTRNDLLHKVMIYALQRNKGPRLKQTKIKLDMSAPYVLGGTPKTCR
jgi:hypothetical protein